MSAKIRSAVGAHFVAAFELFMEMLNGAHCSRNILTPFLWKNRRIGYNHLSRGKSERMNARSRFVLFTSPEARP
jgi:hypothetical protein